MAPTAKSVVFDIETNWGGTYIGLRSVDFYLDGVKINLEGADFTAYATSSYSATYSQDKIFNTSLSKVGSNDNTNWYSSNTAAQRVVVVFSSSQTFDEIVVNNSHSIGLITDRGVKDVVITSSTDEITSTTYAATVSNGTELFDGTFTQHIASDTVDDQTVYTYQNPEPLAYWQEPYNIGYEAQILSFTEPWQTISDYLTLGYTEPMAYALLASWREPYRSTPQHLVFWREPYLAAPEYVRSFNEPYISAAELLAFWREEWTEQPAILAAWVEPYRVADAALLVSITEPYSLEELSQLMPVWREQYAMTIGTSLYQRVERVH